jgi:hypothetical protein
MLAPYLSLARQAECLVKGPHDLREILGPMNQELMEPSLQPALIDHLLHNCITLLPGTWDADLESFADRGQEFTAIMHRTRLYGGEKVTHIHKTGEEDQKHQVP